MDGFMNYDSSRARESNHENVTYKINKDPRKGRCRIIANDHPCIAKIKSRGLCPTHFHRFDNLNQVDKWGTEKK